MKRNQLSLKSNQIQRPHPCDPVSPQPLGVGHTPRSSRLQTELMRDKTDHLSSIKNTTAVKKKKKKEPQAEEPYTLLI